MHDPLKPNSLDANPGEQDSNDPATDERPSKSARKRAAQAAQKLGEQLAELKANLLDDLELDAGLRAAIDKYQSFKSREARRRQRQFIGSLMRTQDTQAINARLQNLTEHDASSKLIHHELETWRDRLIGDTGNEALTAYLGEHNNCDSQQLRLLVRRARSALDDQQRRTSHRALYRFLARQSTT